MESHLKGKETLTYAPHLQPKTNKHKGFPHPRPLNTLYLSVKYKILRDILKQKFSLFLNSLIELFLEALYLAAYILIGFFLSNLIKWTIGEKWSEVAEVIKHGTLIIISVIGAIRFIARTVVKTYKDLNKEIKDEHDESY